MRRFQQHRRPERPADGGADPLGQQPALDGGLRARSRPAPPASRGFGTPGGAGARVLTGVSSALAAGLSCSRGAGGAAAAAGGVAGGAAGFAAPTPPGESGAGLRLHLFGKKAGRGGGSGVPQSAASAASSRTAAIEAVELQPLVTQPPAASGSSASRSAKGANNSDTVPPSASMVVGEPVACNALEANAFFIQVAFIKDLSAVRTQLAALACAESPAAELRCASRLISELRVALCAAIASADYRCVRYFTWAASFVLQVLRFRNVVSLDALKPANTSLSWLFELVARGHVVGVRREELEAQMAALQETLDAAADRAAQESSAAETTKLGPEGPEGSEGPEGPKGSEGSESPLSLPGPEGPKGPSGPGGAQLSWAAAAERAAATVSDTPCSALLTRVRQAAEEAVAQPSAFPTRALLKEIRAACTKALEEAIRKGQRGAAQSKTRVDHLFRELECIACVTRADPMFRLAVFSDNYYRFLDAETCAFRLELDQRDLEAARTTSGERWPKTGVSADATQSAPDTRASPSSERHLFSAAHKAEFTFHLLRQTVRRKLVVENIMMAAAEKGHLPEECGFNMADAERRCRQWWRDLVDALQVFVALAAGP